VIDWDDTYNNARHIPDSADYPPRWAALAAEFRQSRPTAGIDLTYGSRQRERYDLFHPDGKTQGLAIFVHGGYWKAFDKSSWSHLAAGALARGWAIAIPSYDLCPEVRIADITRQIGRAVSVIAEQSAGPLSLVGHSAGGHLVSRLCCADSPLPDEIRARLVKALSISGLHDLRPLLQTEMNRTLRLDADEAERESPALLAPLSAASVSCWAGDGERPEFVRQNALLSEAWRGKCAYSAAHLVEGRHHYDVIDELANPGSEMVEALVNPSGA
jgi:arylformamidase